MEAFVFILHLAWQQTLSSYCFNSYGEQMSFSETKNPLTFSVFNCCVLFNVSVKQYLRKYLSLKGYHSVLVDVHTLTRIHTSINHMFTQCLERVAKSLLVNTRSRLRAGSS